MTTETKIWRKIAPVLRRYGLATRVENASAGCVPDAFFVFRKETWFLELKVLRSGAFQVTPHQLAYMKGLARALPPNRVWYIIGEGDKLYADSARHLLNTSELKQSETKLRVAPTEIFDYNVSKMSAFEDFLRIESGALEHDHQV